MRDTLAFYAGTARDQSGGFFHFFKDDGRVYDRTTRHLVSSTRFIFIFNYAMAYRHFGDTRYQDDARHAFAFLRDAHWDAALEGYDWEIEWRDGSRRTLDGTRHCEWPSCCSPARMPRWRASTKPGR